MTELLPCPFCGGTDSQVREQHHWTGMRSVVISATVIHWCTWGGVRASLHIKGKNSAEAIERWNTRAHQ